MQVMTRGSAGAVEYSSLVAVAVALACTLQLVCLSQCGHGWVFVSVSVRLCVCALGQLKHQHSSRTGNEHIIQISVTEGQSAQNLVNEPLESLCRVAETKGHVQKLKEAKRSDNGCLWNVRRLHGNLVVGSHRVQFAEDSSTM